MVRIDETHEMVEGAFEWQRTVVNQWIAAFNAHDVTAIVALYAEDAELFDAGMKRRRHGARDIENWFTTRFRTMPSIAYVPAGQLFGEGQAVVTWTASGRAPKILGFNILRTTFRVDGISHFTLRDGHIVAQRGYYDHIAVLEQLLPPLRWVVPRL